MKSGFTFLFLLFLSVTVSAQQVTCDQFCVIDIRYNLAFPEGLVVQIQFNSDTQQFINYPFVSAILNEAGDTVATGDIFYFGQFSNTTTDYPVMSVDSFPENFVGTVVFRFDFDTTVCYLPVPCKTSAVNYHSSLSSASVVINPNPVSDEAILKSSYDLTGANIEIISMTGQLVQHITGMPGNQMPLNFQRFSPGVYFLKVVFKENVMGIVKIVVE